MTENGRVEAIDYGKTPAILDMDYHTDDRPIPIRSVGTSGFQTDAGGRTKTSFLTTLGDYKLIGFDRSLLWDTEGTGTGTWENNKYSMSVTSGQYLIRQTRKFHSYFSGKAQDVEQSFYKFAPEANVTKRIGYFSSSASAPYNTVFDGFWLESAGSTITLKVARAGTYTLSIDLADWSGYAGLAEYKTIATWNNFSVVYFDFLWLGGAVLRLWVKTSVGWILAHEFDYAGTAQDTFTKSPSHPLRYEIVSTTGSGTLYYVCSQVATEGSVDESGHSRFVHSGTSMISCTNAGTSYALVGMKKASAYRDVGALITGVSAVLGTNNDYGIWEIRINPTVSGVFTYGALSGSPIEYAIGATSNTVTGGTVMTGGDIRSASPLDSEQLKLNHLAWLGGAIDNVMDTYVFCVTPLSGTLTAHAGIGFKIF